MLQPHPKIQNKLRLINVTPKRYYNAVSSRNLSISVSETLLNVFQGLRPKDTQLKRRLNCITSILANKLASIISLCYGCHGVVDAIMSGMKICFELTAAIIICHLTFSTRGGFPDCFRNLENLK